MPHYWDWRDHFGVSPVKDQGSCGSCWTFSTVGALEAHSQLKFGYTNTYSEQQLVDCAGDFDNNGCDGGLPSHAFEYVYHAGGISTETAYPYFAEDHNCTVDSGSFDITVHGSYNITEGDENELQKAVYHAGPVSVAYQVVDGFKDYHSGVYTSDTCNSTTQDVNHAVLAVGYGREAGLDYWLIKNSWGTEWGAGGFFKIERNANMCGIAVCNSFPLDIRHIEKQEFLQ
uniref:Peptidase C1A papain C-terminal domain-containing protein n=1 Tax=Strombidium inclinatum TaxID=197538 RepID=A0A7S3ISI1_9SPIT|mmetsp:Transcript_34585/g.52908  ORF Transcript_34585/g.52908 Transcript_34585/m.52908 type:complete len:229 (+) Transcript_34585:393-1079(+)